MCSITPINLIRSFLKVFRCGGSTSIWSCFLITLSVLYSIWYRVWCCLKVSLIWEACWIVGASSVSGGKYPGFVHGKEIVSCLILVVIITYYKGQMDIIVSDHIGMDGWTIGIDVLVYFCLLFLGGISHNYCEDWCWEIGYDTFNDCSLHHLTDATGFLTLSRYN